MTRPTELVWPATLARHLPSRSWRVRGADDLSRSDCREFFCLHAGGRGSRSTGLVAAREPRSCGARTNSRHTFDDRADQFPWAQCILACRAIEISRRRASPPRDCRAFYVVERPAPAGAAWWRHQTDAVLIAVLFGIPTVNGNSSNHPAGWRLLDPSAPDYMLGVKDWARAKGLSTGLCGLEPRTGLWAPAGFD